MNVIVVEDKKEKIKRGTNKVINWLVYVILYSFILILISILFDETFILDYSNFGLWALIASIIIYILNKTIKPILFVLTLPITGLTLGLFYPFINVLIIKITALILGEHFITHGIFILFFAAILISILNFLLENMIIKPLIKKGE